MLPVKIHTGILSNVMVFSWLLIWNKGKLQASMISSPDQTMYQSVRGIWNAKIKALSSPKEYQ